MNPEVFNIVLKSKRDADGEPWKAAIKRLVDSELLPETSNVPPIHLCVYGAVTYQEFRHFASDDEIRTMQRIGTMIQNRIAESVSKKTEGNNGRALNRLLWGKAGII